MSAWPKPGVHHGVSERDYHALDWRSGVVSKSLLWDFAPNPYVWKYGPPKEVTNAMNWGSLVDCLLLTPERLKADFVISPYDEFRTNEAKAWRDSQTKSIVKAADIEAAGIAVTALKRSPFVETFIASANSQISVVLDGVEPETGMPFRAKCRIDIVPFASPWLVDLKTTGLSPNKIPSIIADFGYHIQASMYLDLWNRATGESRDRWAFIFQSQNPPYEVAVVELDPSDIGDGRAWYQAALAKWCRCQRDQNFPSPWEDEIKVVSRPAWAKKGDA